MAIIGIDLGTTNSLVTTFKDGNIIPIPNQFGEYLTPSVVNINEEGQFTVGKIAKEKLISEPFATTSLFKRNMGTSKKVKLREKLYSPEELSSFVLMQLLQDAKTFLNEPIEEAVISVPAYFDSYQRAATKLAGQMAGIKVERLINEPSAAALACRDTLKDEIFIVFDFGGGTLDVSIVECFDNVINICAIAGDNRLGGRDFDTAIVEAFCKANYKSAISLNKQNKEMLLRIAEKAKTQLSENDKVKLTATVDEQKWEMELTNDILFDLSANIFRRIKQPIRKAMNDSGLNASDIDKCVLVGGSCHMPIVQQYLKSILNIPITNPGNIDQIVASGLGLYAGMKSRDASVKSLVLTDICPFSLGTEVHNENNPNKPLMHTLIKRNSVLPTSKKDTFWASELGQTGIHIGIYQGEELYAKDNLFLGELYVSIPKNFKNREEIEIRYSYDINAILVVDVTVVSTQKNKTVVLVGNRLTELTTQLQNQVEAMKATSLYIHKDRRFELLLERAKRIYAEAGGDLKPQMESIVFQCEKIEEISSTVKQRKEIEQYEQLLDRIEDNIGNSDIFINNHTLYQSLLKYIHTLYDQSDETNKRKLSSLLEECEGLTEIHNPITMMREIERIEKLVQKIEKSADEPALSDDFWIS